MITKTQRNKLKNMIVNRMTKGENAIFDKKTGNQCYNGTDLNMVMGCVFMGLTDGVDKD